MTLNEQILEFLDGGLSPDAEAELMHRLSVSPERRQALRSFLNQRAFIQRDKSSIAVPYEAEQKLWARLEGVMPAVTDVSTTAIAPVGAGVATGVATGFFAGLSGFFSSLTSGLSGNAFSTGGAVALSALTLIVGLGTGFFAGTKNAPRQVIRDYVEVPVAAQSVAGQNATTQNGASAPTEISNSLTSQKSSLSNASRQSRVSSLAPVLAALENNAIAETPEQLVVDTLPSLAEATTTATPQSDEIQPVVAARVAPVQLRSIGGEDGIKPIFIRDSREVPIEKTILQRFEFSFSESFGQQFPNSEATSVSRPLITNSMVSAFFQVFPNSNKLWVGTSFGTANLTHKKLFLAASEVSQPQEGLDGDYVHIQSNWVGGFLQYRMPFIGISDLMFTGGYGIATAGQMVIGEVGVHYDATRDVGFQVGLRGTHLNYDLTAEKEEIINSRRGALGIHYGAADAPPSYNVEVNAGLFFHF